MHLHLAVGLLIRIVNTNARSKQKIKSIIILWIEGIIDVFLVSLSFAFEQSVRFADFMNPVQRC